MRALAYAGLAALLLACSEEPGPPAPPEVADCAPGSTATRSAFAIRFPEGESVSSARRVVIDLRPVDGRPPPADVGEGDFTIELWLRGARDEQVRPSKGYRAPRQSEASELDWIHGNIVLDRDIWHWTFPGFGMSVHRDGDPGDEPDAYARGVVRFGARPGTLATGGEDEKYTLQGRSDVLDGRWHHVALVRDAARGRLAIHVDGRKDAESPADGSLRGSDLSYPAGAEADENVRDPETTPLLVIGTEKHDLGGEFPGFKGLVDELRFWRVARTPAEIAASFDRIVPPGTPGLAASFRMEAGAGPWLLDRTGGPPARYVRPGWLDDFDPWSSDAAPVRCPE